MKKLPAFLLLALGSGCADTALLDAMAYTAQAEVQEWRPNQIPEEMIVQIYTEIEEIGWKIIFTGGDPSEWVAAKTFMKGSKIEVYSEFDDMDPCSRAALLAHELDHATRMDADPKLYLRNHRFGAWRVAYEILGDKAQTSALMACGQGLTLEYLTDWAHFDAYERYVHIADGTDLEGEELETMLDFAYHELVDHAEATFKAHKNLD